jgi:hypothetical protein
MTFRRRLSSKQREQLYQAEAEKAREAGRGEFPICRLCNMPIIAGSLWDANHEANKPHWLGGEIDGISHKRCNRLHNNQVDTPLFAKSERVRKKHLDFTRSRSPMRGGRNDTIRKTMRGEVVPRLTRPAPTER